MTPITAASPSEPRYGWVLVGLGALSIGFQGGILLANALFLVAIAEDTGWPRATIAGAISLLVLGNAAWSPVVGWLIQRHGSRWVMPPAALVLGLGLFLLSRARSPLELAAIMLLLLPPGAVGAGTLANYAAIQGWFQRRRGTALALADAGSALGGLVVVPFVGWLIGAHGWRGAYQGLA
ncbi:MAG: MFS transporter, partial [Chloroflexota bacterium]|nr:MFS transporter [Chloroflexota bacterium]